MRLIQLLIAAAVLTLAGSAQAATKWYNSLPGNGTPGDGKRISINICPPIVVTADSLGGFKQILDDGTGTVTLADFTQCCAGTGITDLTPDILTPVFGPGAFIFIDNQSTRTVSVTTQTSNTSGIGAHGPSGTGPGESVEWGVISGFELTGALFCVASPIGICNENGFSHGMTIPPTLPSTTYDLGTWNFDSIGDLAAADYIITRTSNGGLSNNHELHRGAFQGASLPALPLVGFGALALGLVVIGGRALFARK